MTVLFDCLDGFNHELDKTVARRQYGVLWNPAGMELVLTLLTSVVLAPSDVADRFKFQMLCGYHGSAS